MGAGRGRVSAAAAEEAGDLSLTGVGAGHRATQRQTHRGRGVGAEAGWHPLCAVAR